MSGEATLDELLEVQAYFGLPSPALIEKDFYVIRALAAVAAASSGKRCMCVSCSAVARR